MYHSTSLSYLFVILEYAIQIQVLELSVNLYRYSMDKDETREIDAVTEDNVDLDSTTTIMIENTTKASTEAGAMRGVARSFQNVGQRFAKFPAVGRLPAPKPTVSTGAGAVPSLSSYFSKQLPKIPSARTAIPARHSIPKNIPKPPRIRGSVRGGGGGATTSTTATINSRSMAPPTTAKSIPVRQVAKVSDRVSTGLGVLDTAQETGVVSGRLSRMISFAISKCETQNCTCLCRRMCANSVR